MDALKKAQMQDGHFPTGGCFFQWTDVWKTGKMIILLTIEHRHIEKREKGISSK
jgi:hypothetical protein